ncbi:unnamed protein product, partial [Allacma fusca]
MTINLAGEIHSNLAAHSYKVKNWWTSIASLVPLFGAACMILTLPLA